MNRFQYDDEYVGADVDMSADMPLDYLTASGAPLPNVAYVQESKSPRTAPETDSE